MSSVSSTSSSLGNTALRGFGGLASGIDRDALIEQMTARTTSKITSKKQAMTKLEWKRDAYRSISNKIIDLQDNYLSYSATKSLKNSDFFAKNQVSVQGDPDYTKYISATGNADTASRVSVLGVNKLATSATLISGEKKTDSAITLGGISASDFSNKEIKTSNLSGTKLTFGTYSITDKQFTTEATFTFPTSYEKKLDNGKTETVTIDYTASSDKIVEQLNEALDSQGFLGKDGKSGIKFTLNGDQIQISQTDSITDKGKSCVIRETSSALKSLGFNSGKMNQDDIDNGISLDEFNASSNKSSFEAAAITKQPLSGYLKGKSISVSYGGQTKNIELIGDKEEIKDFKAFKDSLQNKLDKAFGSGKVTVGEGQNGSLTFTAKDNKQTLQISADSKELQNALGITSTQSNKISTGSSLWENRVKLGLGKYDTKEKLNDALKNFTVNGAKIDNITADTTVDGLLTAINNNKDAGVTATYLGSENKFVLSSNEKGEGRKITLGADPKDTTDAANLIFGGVSQDGTDGEMSILYNGVQTTITSSSNTFSIDGLDIRATNTFNTGSATAEGGVSFTASADTEKVTETVKKFIEAYNAMIDEVRTQATTKPDSNYKPLTDDQKNEMNENSIKNWEDKAKEGILYNSSALKDLDNATQGIFSSMMMNGVSYDDLEKIGISFSDDYTAGGKIVFDEEKFKTAMDSDPEKVSDLFTGTHGIVNTIDSTLSTYATRYASKNGNSYGVLIEEAGSEKLSLTLTNNSIYKELKDMQETITNLQSQLSTEQDRYISQFTQMERLINQMNSQSSYLSQLGG
ncbi:Flagellar capping protein [butyrate-producing bacterium SS3/4]|uniref:flagellar filament capping protein FliD n=1 Tax=Clostridium sp. MCC328 TaxID=2592642 RepID=UPI0001CE5AAC|nr:flagellar filament capping protein FliD [Clostridium sp. MCC328]MBT9819292.1 flagellar filament capping protein FliD [Clostridium sp. MCC328]CBL40865.1 Flagellar capping protein [butyrate-producing bacterium SS3/4]